MKKSELMKRRQNNRSFTSPLLVGVILCSWTAIACAGGAVITDANPSYRAFTSDGAAVIKAVPVGSATGSPAGLITSAYPGWTVNSGGASPGLFNVTTYRAGTIGSSGGTQIDVSYNYGAPVPSGQQLQWVQVITTNDPLGGATSPYLDPQPNDDALPFYWTSAELPSYGTPSSLNFHDYSKRDSAELATKDPISWRANLYLVQWDGAKAVSVMDGVSWGWDMMSATKGSATGKFVSPGPGGATTSGIGTSHFTWGTGTPGSLDFTGASFDPKPGDTFKLGTLVYHNGTTDAGSEASSVSLDTKLAFDNVPDKVVDLVSGLSIVNTPNNGLDPNADADYVSFVSGGFTHSFHVVEGASAQVDLMAKIVAGAVTPQPGAAGKSLDSPTEFISDLNYHLELVDFANAGTGGFTTMDQVPEPAAFVLAMFAGAMTASRRLKRHA